MNPLLKLVRPAGRGLLQPGVPFSSRFDHAAGTGALSNRAYIRAWVVRQSAKTLLPLRRVR